MKILQKVPSNITVEVMRSTDLGKTIHKLAKHQSKSISQAATPIFEALKNVIRTANESKNA